MPICLATVFVTLIGFTSCMDRHAKPFIVSNLLTEGPDSGLTPEGASSSARPYSDESPWNTALPADPAVASDSDLLIAALGENFGARVLQFTMPVYPVNGQTPLKTVVLSGLLSVVANGNSTLTRQFLASVQVPIPDGARAAEGSDSQIVLWNPDTGDEWGFWQAGESADGTWSAVNGYRYNTRWNGIPPRAFDDKPFGSRGSGVPYLAGLIRPWEIVQGRIRHAIAFGYQNPSPAFVAPATKSDGTGSGMPEGTRIQLNPEYDTSGLSRTGRIITQAMKEYGLVLIDCAGHPKIYGEYQETAGWSNDPSALDYWSENVVKAVPYTKFRVIRTSVSTGMPIGGASGIRLPRARTMVDGVSSDRKL